MIEFLFWEDCPSHERALSRLIEEMDAQGLERDDLRVIEVFNQRDAEREHFIGSPTIRLDGVDIVDPGDTPPSMDCRIYHRRDGKVSPLPDPDDLKEAIAAYAHQRQ